MSYGIVQHQTNNNNKEPSRNGKENFESLLKCVWRINVKTGEIIHTSRCLIWSSLVFHHQLKERDREKEQPAQFSIELFEEIHCARGIDASSVVDVLTKRIHVKCTHT